MDSEEEAIRRAKEVTFVHSRGGFIIRGRMSNSEKVLQKLGESTSAEAKELSKEIGNFSERVLGVLWMPRVDAFTYSANFVTVPEWPTKRELLKTVMSLYDPLGFLSHFTVHGTILIKQKNLQLHIFVDTSMAAFACVAYLRAEVAGQIQCALVTGKAKVAPLKLMSVPRLELQAAVLGSRLVESICSTHTLPITKRFIWTDSKTVLGWINSDQRSYRQFVAFRTGEILEKTKANEWHWVPSDSNASDDATKWKRGPNLCPEGRWFGGPDFLHLSEEYWPSIPEEKYDTTEEQQSSMVMHHYIIDSVFDWERFSNWNRLTRTVGFVVRYLGNLREIARQLPTTKGPLSQAELAKAEAWIFHSTQKEIFAKEVTMLSTVDTTGKSVRLDSDSKLFKLSPFLNNNGVLRVETRISLAAFALYDTRNPIILPRYHRVTKLIILWYHQKLLHGNMETVINELRHRFHISNLRTVVRGAVKECLQCRVSKAVPSVPRMSPLPAARLGAFFRPFTFLGLDYFGTMTVRVGRSIVKRWVALFTCLSIRAVHLEVVHSLSTESCMMAVRRFVARRGSSSEIYSDNATNFLGASNELRNEIRSINGNIAETFTTSNTKWLFIPPASPHMGGAWERMERSVKVAFYAIPTEETFGTVLVEAESIVNSRPLTLVPSNEENQEALTPNHFLLMNSNGAFENDRRSGCCMYGGFILAPMDTRIFAHNIPKD
ncbi:uncharacterized protein LOC129761145 [Toxorhynchites rutilus septentrionalis]|uniref:uncharacterized protein LOC129761145 n=1 Tax=Toxorhynchites rutilus septentrionalis TaxID=329112 RepID=UPI00247926FB|nr:uncharacterized protein LOC129761145 [Toxorhynchites rutilus septentrionalis]